MADRATLLPRPCDSPIPTDPFGNFMVVLLLLFLSVVPALSTTCDTGVSDAPCRQAPLRTVVVDAAGSGQYTLLQLALDAAKPGDEILIKPGTYTNTGIRCGDRIIVMSASGTKENPIYIGAFDPLRPPRLNVDFQVGCEEGTGEWVIAENLELSSSYTRGIGLKAFADHTTYRKNNVHENSVYTVLQNGSHQLFEHNTFSYDGEEVPPAVSNFTRPCPTLHHVTIRHNRFVTTSSTGTHISIPLSSCTDPVWDRKAHDYLIEYNIFEGKKSELFLEGLTQSVVQHNTHIAPGMPFLFGPSLLTIHP